MPSGKSKTPEKAEAVKEEENEQFEEFSEKIYSMVLELTRDMETVLEKLEILTEKPKYKSNTNSEGTYSNKRNAYIKKLNEGAIGSGDPLPVPGTSTRQCGGATQRPVRCARVPGAPKGWVRGKETGTRSDQFVLETC